MREYVLFEEACITDTVVDGDHFQSRGEEEVCELGYHAIRVGTHDRDALELE